MQPGDPPSFCWGLSRLRVPHPFDYAQGRLLCSLQGWEYLSLVSEGLKSWNKRTKPCPPTPRGARAVATKSLRKKSIASSAEEA
jgi:hypothetical protein